MKKIIVTGSASGVGWLTVKTLAQKGNSVYATMRNGNASNAAAARCVARCVLNFYLNQAG